MRFFKLFTLFVTVALLGVGCNSYKKVPYIQNSKEYNYDSAFAPAHEARIMPKDMLSITVNTSDPLAAVPFNLFLPTNGSSSSSVSLLPFLVDNKGKIDYPTLGTLDVGGLTLSEAELLIATELKPYLKEVPVVRVLIDNFNISVLGAVGSPGHFNVSDNQVTILEAIAMAGDLNIYGQRPDIKVIREDKNGKRVVVELDINDTDILYSPYYYLQQNDVVYVTPNKTLSRSAELGAGTTIWFTLLSTLMSITTFIVMLSSL